MAEEQEVGVGRGSLTEALGAALGTAISSPPPAEKKEAPAAEKEAPKEASEPKPATQGQGNRPQGGGPRDGQRGPRPEGKGNRDNRPPREGGPRRDEGKGGGPQGGDRREGKPGGDRRDGGRPPERRDFAPEIEIEKLLNDSLYLDNQAHLVVSRMRDLDSGTRSQLRRLYSAVRRATRASEAERQHEFVMLRARLAYTIARHGLRSLDQLERLLLQVTRRNEARGYERFRDLFEAIVAYNE